MSRGSMASPRVIKAQIVDITCGENVTIIEPSNVYGCDLKNDVFIGAGSVVTKDITEKGIYAGNPAKKLRDLP
jgi:acetyltransferase-like isoleucine patch superfamily enzyme